MRFLTSVLALCVLVCITWAALEKPSGCGIDLGCYSDCNGTCKFVVTWKKNGNNVDFTQSFTLESGGSDQYIALGLSDDRRMGSDSVTECVMKSGSVVVAKSYNDGRSNSILTEASAGLTNVAGSVSDGVLRCSYSQTIASSNDKIFSLESKWYLLVANGKASNGDKSQHSLKNIPAVSPIKADLLPIDDLSGTAKAVMKKPSGCGIDIGCYSDCDGTCKFVVTWKQNGNKVDFTQSFTLEPGGSDQYIALGLSDDQKMGSDSVTECVMKSGSVVVAKSYNSGESNSILTEASAGLTNVTGSVSDGVLRCSYSQTKASSNDKIFSLESVWYLLVANGNASNGDKSRHSLENLPAVSPSKADLLSTDDLSGTAKAVMVKLHGALMMIAWIFCASIGIVLARHYKPMWPNSQVCSEKVWFSFHRACMIAAFVTCAAGFIIIFVDVKDWSKLTGATNWQKAHPYLGVVVTFCVVLNPVMALFRPHPDEKHRYIFNWAHWIVGTGAQLLSGMALILGVTLGRASVPFYLVWVLVAWVAYQILIELILELLDCCVADNSRRYYKDGSLKDPRGSLLKKIILAFHVFVITGFTIFSIVTLAIN